MTNPMKKLVHQLLDTEPAVGAWGMAMEPPVLGLKLGNFQDARSCILTHKPRLHEETLLEATSLIPVTLAVPRLAPACELRALVHLPRAGTCPGWAVSSPAVCPSTAQGAPPSLALIFPP